MARLFLFEKKRVPRRYNVSSHEHQIKPDISITDGSGGSSVTTSFSVRLSTRLGARVIIVFIRVSCYTNYFYPLSVGSKYNRTLFFDLLVRN